VSTRIVDPPGLAEGTYWKRAVFLVDADWAAARWKVRLPTVSRSVRALCQPCRAGQAGGAEDWQRALILKVHYSFSGIRSNAQWSGTLLALLRPALQCGSADRS